MINIEIIEGGARMKCISCSKEIKDGSVFCEFCGSQQLEVSLLDESKEISKGKDGVYRWVYELNMWTNPGLLITLLNVVLLATAFPTLLVSLLELFERGFSEAIEAFVTVGGFAGGIMVGLAIIAYIIIAVLNGGKYCVAFEMDEKGIRHIQMDKQFKRSQVLSMITVLAGALANNPTAMGAGLLANAKKTSYSQFSKVKNIKAKRNLNIIYVNESFERNQIYVSREDFNSVYDYIAKRCKKANIK